MKKVVVNVFICLYFVITILITYCLLSYNEYNIPEFNNYLIKSECNTNSNTINNSNDDRYNYIPDNYIKDDITISSTNSNIIKYNNITIRNTHYNTYINPYE